MIKAITQTLVSLLALFGAGLSGYIVLIKAMQTGCSTTACNTVLSSPYASVFGVSNASLGVGFYLVLLLLSIRRDLFLALIGIGTAALASLGLILIQAFIIKDWCFLCITSASTITLLLILIAWLYQQNPEKPRWDMGYLLVLSAVFLTGPILHYGVNSIVTRDSVIIHIDGKGYTQSDVDAELGLRMIKLKNQQNQLRKNWAYEYAIAREAAANQVAPGVLMHMVFPSQPSVASINAYQTYLEDTYQIAFTLPTSSQINLPRTPHTFAKKGPDNAAFRIVSFSDIQCPYCKTKHQELDALQARYPQAIQIEYRHFPLDHHPEAKRAARGSWCAGQSGQFWAFLDATFDQAQSLSPSSLMTIAKDLDLDTQAFLACLTGPDSLNAVELDIQAGIQLGVSQTPSVFVNGHYTSDRITAKSLGLPE